MAERRKFWKFGVTLYIMNIGLIVTTLLTLGGFFILLKAVSINPPAWAWLGNVIILQIFFAGVIFTFLLTVFYIVNRSLGPLPRVERILDDILKGDYSQRISIRKKDLMRGFMEKLNTLLGQLQDFQKQ